MNARVQPNAWTAAWAQGVVWAFAGVAIATEVLSAFRALDAFHVRILWALGAAAVGAGLARRGRRRPAVAATDPSEAERGLGWAPGALAFLLGATLAAALLYPPNTWDSMTYHMARVVHWIDQRSVAFYPTACERQNYQMPLAEFAILHLQLLAGSDRLANLVQWIGYATSIALAALIAGEFGLGRAGRRAAALVAATVPMALLQSSGTQNDLVVGCFALSFAWHMLRLRRDFTWDAWVGAGLSLGLALLAKGVAYAYGAALGLALAGPVLRAAGSGRGALRRAGGLAAAVGLALALNGGVYARHFALYGVPLASGADRYWVQDVAPRALLAGVPKNLALHFGTAAPRLNEAVLRACRRALGGQLDNPRTTWPGAKFGVVAYSRHEDLAGNPLHVLLVGFALAWAAFRARRLPPGAGAYVAGVALAGLLFAVGFKWQTWGSRLQTPLFLLAAPASALALAAPQRALGRRLAGAVLAALFLYGLPFAVDNRTRSLWSGEWQRAPRLHLYFANRPQLYLSYKRAQAALAACGARDVGLQLRGDDWEYPFWAFAAARGSPMRFRHVGVVERSRILQTNAAPPECVVATRAAAAWTAAGYVELYGDRQLRVLRKPAQLPEEPAPGRPARDDGQNHATD